MFGHTLIYCSTFLSVSRHLAGEVAKEWQEVEENDKTQQEMLLKLVKEIVPYNMAHNAEHEACDLLMEIERLDMLEDYIDENAYGKVCLYLTRYVGVFDLLRKQTPLCSMLYTSCSHVDTLTRLWIVSPHNLLPLSTSCVSYVPEPENSALLRCALNIFRKFNRYPEALRLALMLNDVELVENIFTSCKDM